MAADWGLLAKTAALAAIAATAGENNIDDAPAARLAQALAPLLSDATCRRSD